MRFLMRLPLPVSILALVAAFVAAAAAAEPAPLLKPVTPGGQQLRVRLPVSPGFPKTMSFPAQLPRGGKKKSSEKKEAEKIDVTVALDSLPGKSYVTAKKLQSWGYDVPKDKEFLLPELTFTAAQVAPKPLKGHDSIVRLTNVKLTVVDSPGSSDDTVYFCDLGLSASSFYLGNERAMEPRLSFGDKFLELTVPTTITRRPGSEDGALVEVTSSTDTTLVPAYGSMISRGGIQVFGYASINGQDSYKTANGKVFPVNVTVSSITNVPSGVIVTLGLARGCNIEMDQAAPALGATGVEAKSEFIPGKIKELRLAVNMGPGFRTVKDLVIKDLPVLVEKNQSEGYMLLGQKFMDTYIGDAVYAGTGEGWKLHGRIDPTLLFDIKTRPKPLKQ
jgi:hypothetical protein